MSISILLNSVLIGAIASITMHIVMVAVSARLPRRVNMTEALGSMIVQRIDYSKQVGLLCHITGGVFFTFLYASILNLVKISGEPISILVCVVLSFFHGLITSYLLLAYVSKRHPLREYQDASIAIAGIHLFGHLLFGSIIGVLLFTVN